MSHVVQLQNELMKIRVIFPDGNLHEIQDVEARHVRASDVIKNLLIKQQLIINPKNGEINSNSNEDQSMDGSATTWLKRLMINPNPNNWLICPSTSLQIGKRPCPLVPAARLQPGKLYFVLPVRAFQYRLQLSHVSILLSAAEQAIIASQRRQTSSAGTVDDASQPVYAKHGAFRLAGNLIWRRSTRRNNRCPAGSPASDAGVELMYYCANFGGMRSFDILEGACNEARRRYVEQLITRSNCWSPTLHTVHESYY